MLPGRYEHRAMDEKPKAQAPSEPLTLGMVERAWTRTLPHMDWSIGIAADWVYLNDAECIKMLLTIKKYPHLCRSRPSKASLVDKLT